MIFHVLTMTSERPVVVTTHLYQVCDVLSPINPPDIWTLLSQGFLSFVHFEPSLLSHFSSPYVWFFSIFVPKFLDKPVGTSTVIINFIDFRPKLGSQIVV